MLVELPAVLVDGAVVDAAQQDQVVEAGRAAVEPMVEVVGVGPGRRAVAAFGGAGPS
jgi:hypothetical protein